MVQRSDDISKLKKEVEHHKEKSDFRLSLPRTVREGRLLISYDAERKVGEEMLGNQCALMPDGTGRKLIGKVGGMVVQTNKLRTLPFQKMGNEKRENWSDLVLYILKRLSILTGKEKVDFWQSILIFISDQCKINKGMAEMVGRKLGVSHVPGQIYCNIHPILMFDEKLKKV